MESDGYLPVLQTNLFFSTLFVSQTELLINKLAVTYQLLYHQEDYRTGVIEFHTRHTLSIHCGRTAETGDITSSDIHQRGQSFSGGLTKVIVGEWVSRAGDLGMVRELEGRQKTWIDLLGEGG